jgi:hypothetical protein
VAFSALYAGHLLIDGERWFALAVRVGKYPDAIPFVVGTKGSSRKAIPLRVIPERGQVSENVAHPETKQPWRVLHDRVAGSNLAKNSGELAPEARARARKTSSFARR